MADRKLINKIISGYKILDLIGKGGMGEVYRGVHISTGLQAAVKILHDPGMSDRFINEAKLHARLKHPNIARMYGYDLFNGKPCIIMEFIEGTLLQDILKTGQKLDPALALDYFSQLCSALNYLHQNDIIHRDIKPENIKIQNDGQVKLLDFGIAKSSCSPKITREGFTVGTSDYMAPEHLKGHPVMASDVWSLGIIFYRMLTGRLPFAAETSISAHYKMLNGNYPPLRSFLPAKNKMMETIIARCLDPEPGKRYNCRDLLGMINQPDNGRESNETALLRKVRNILREPVKIAPWIGILLITAVTIITISLAGKRTDKQNNTAVQSNAVTDSVRIDVLNVNNARLTFPDQSSFTVPYTIRGQRKTESTFTLSAPGYEDLKVTIELNQRRNTYEYVLQKKD